MKLAILLLALLGGDDDKKGKALQITCKPDALVRGCEILLYDVADVSGQDPALVHRLQGISLGRRPAFGNNRVVSAHEVVQRLLREGLRIEELKVAGAKETVVQALVTMLPPQEVLDASTPVLAAAVREAGADIEFAPATQLKAQQVPPGRRSLDLRPKLRGGQLQATSALVDVDVVVDGEVWSTVSVQYRLRRYAQVLVVTEAVRKGAPLGEHNVDVRRVESHIQTSPYLSAQAQVAGKVANRELRAGERLTLAAIGNPAVVYRGDVVSLVAVRGRVKVSSRAVAQQDGAAGNRITVTDLTTGRPVQAVVEGAGVVSIAPVR
jgi:flagella basal body P-ring formation protein FlgA